MVTRKVQTPASGSTPENRPSDRADLPAWLKLAKAELPPRRLEALLAATGRLPAAALAAPESILQGLGLAAAQIARLRECAAMDISKDVAALERVGGELVTRGDAVYPSLLRPLPDAPPILFIRGELLADDQFSVAIVGSRRATSYGLSIAGRFARELCRYGLSIVSGGARGVDSFAHRGALDSGGRTIAVVGCGLDVAYPAENRRLFQDIVSSGRGAIISEYPIGATPEPWRFPARNRLISGLSLGTLVVESPQNSGAMITAGFAADHGREVFAVPGPIESGRSSGCHRLIQDGAKLVQSPEDIIDELGILRLTDDSSETEPRVGLLAPTANLAPDQRIVLDSLSLEPRSADALADACDMRPAQITAILTMLELRGLARRTPGNGFVRVL